jgi:hypothetical protein
LATRKRVAKHQDNPSATICANNRSRSSLPPADKQELLLFIAARLRSEAGDLPFRRRFSSERLKTWIAQDEAEMHLFRDGNPE